MKNCTLFFVLMAFFFACDDREREVYHSNRTESDSLYIINNYEKQETYIEMRDGTRLFTSIYSPVDKSEKYPIILMRTPYGSKPFGTEKKDYRIDLGPNMHFVRDGYIFVYQDVRGRFLSEGQYVNMTPHNQTDSTGRMINESTDAYDAIDWLINNVDNNNGKVGQWGISYPGFYTVAGMIDAHPGLVAASPQAPVADWFFDDFHHRGAFFLPHAFNFFYFYDRPYRKPFKDFGPRFNFPTDDNGADFFETVTPLSKVKDLYFGDTIGFWNDLAAHPDYDQFWQDRNILNHLSNINCAVLTVGGWYDAEDLYGTFSTYRTLEERNPLIQNSLIMGPWSHGGWRRTDGDRLGDVHFKEKTSTFFNNEVIFPFFSYHLKGKEDPDLAEAIMFETGSNRWRTFDQWPPKVESTRLYFKQQSELSFIPPRENEFGADIYHSDPNDPVPYTQYEDTWMPKPYMVEDQRFVADRKDVLVYQTEPLEEALTIAGPIEAHMIVKTNQGDADFVVKLIDVYPDDHTPFPHQREKAMGGYQQMIRSEVIRGRFRNSYENPEPFPNMTEEEVNLKLQDVLHTFKSGHRIMVQIQSSWWPMVDINPQKYVENIFEASTEDFTKAKIIIGRSGKNPSYLRIGILN